MRLPLALLALVALAPAAAACEGLSPGDHIVSDGASCTLAFIVANPDGLYFATAGHCLKMGSTVSSDGHGDIGVTVFRYLNPDTGSSTDGAPGEDFGLIRIHPQLYDSLNPALCAWGGPTGIVTDASADGGGVRHHGYGLLLGDLPPTRAREGFLLETVGTYSFHWVGAGVPGDSGSAVIAEDGRALGVLTHVQLGTAHTATNGGTHLLRGFELAEAAGFKGLRLVLQGEDPRAVLAQLQGGGGGGAPGDVPDVEPAPTPNGSSPDPASPRPTTPTATPPPANGGGSDEGVAPARDGAPAATADGGGADVPGAPLAVVLAVLAGVALRQRSRR